MKNFNYKAAIYFGIATSLFFILQNLLTSDILTTKTILKSIGFGLLSGVRLGFFLGLIIGWFNTSKFVDKTAKIETYADETILFHTPANHFIGTEGVGGKLFLTNKRLVFKSHKLNILNHELSIKLTDIIKIDRYKKLGFINNGLTITSKDLKVDKFVVEQAKEWIVKLT